MRQKDAASGLHDDLVKARADVLRVESNLAGTIEALRSEVAAHRAENAVAFASLEKEPASRDPREERQVAFQAPRRTRSPERTCALKHRSARSAAMPAG